MSKLSIFWFSDIYLWQMFLICVAAALWERWRSANVTLALVGLIFFKSAAVYNSDDDWKPFNDMKFS